MGRRRDTRWGARGIDIDLLAGDDGAVLPSVEQQTRWRTLSLADQQTLTPDELILPHPRLQDRAFVLIPLAEIAPDFRHPVTGQGILDMVAHLPAKAVAEMLRWDQGEMGGIS